MICLLLDLDQQQRAEIRQHPSGILPVEEQADHGALGGFFHPAGAQGQGRYLLYERFRRDLEASPFARCRLALADLPDREESLLLVLGPDGQAIVGW